MIRLTGVGAKALMGTDTMKDLLLPCFPALHNTLMIGCRFQLLLRDQLVYGEMEIILD